MLWNSYLIPQEVRMYSLSLFWKWTITKTNVSLHEDTNSCETRKLYNGLSHIERKNLKERILQNITYINPPPLPSDIKGYHPQIAVTLKLLFHLDEIRFGLMFGTVFTKWVFRCVMSHVLQNFPIKLFFDAFVYSSLGLYY